MRKLIVAFDEPSDGWLRIELRYEGHVLAEPFSHIYPTLGELCGALSFCWSRLNSNWQ